MNAKSCFASIVAGMSLVLVSSAGQAQTFYKDLRYPNLREVQMPEVERVELENGMVVFLLEDHEVPLVQMNVQVGVGPVCDPPDKTGLATIAWKALRTGGTLTMSGDEIDQALEQIAASVETKIDSTACSASLWVLKEHLDRGLAILADILMHPIFPDDRIELAKIQERTAIARRNDDPFGITYREFNKLIYGVGSPYAGQTEYDTINAITRQDLIGFHKQYFHPNNTLLAAWGDFESTDMLGKIKQAFGKWPKATFQRPKLPPVNYQFEASVHLVKKEDLSQTYVIMGHVGDLMSNPDYPALIVISNILGGVSGRIFTRLGARMGLAYAAYAYYWANYDYPGWFWAECQTKSESTMLAITAMKEEVERLTRELPTDEELETAKGSYLNSFVFNFEDKGAFINRIMAYEYYGYPKDFLQRERQGVEKTSREDVLRVAKRYIHPDQLRILAVGNPAKFDRPLSTLGEVREVDITIRGPKK